MPGIYYNSDECTFKKYTLKCWNNDSVWPTITLKHIHESMDIIMYLDGCYVHNSPANAIFIAYRTWNTIVHVRNNNSVAKKNISWKLHTNPRMRERERKSMHCRKNHPTRPGNVLWNAFLEILKPIPPLLGLQQCGLDNTTNLVTRGRFGAAGAPVVLCLVGPRARHDSSSSMAHFTYQ